MNDNSQLPTSDMETFRQQLFNVNTVFENQEKKSNIIKLQKNLVVSYVADPTGCGHIRNIFPLSYLNALYGKSGRYNILFTPTFIFQHDILMKSRSLFFQRAMAPQMIEQIAEYKKLQTKYGYKMVYDIDDFIWNGPDEGECIPPYNFGSTKIGQDVQDAAIVIMNMMDTVCVSTQFLGDYIKKKGVTSEIKVVPNAVAQYFWGNTKRKPIKEKIKKPRVIYTGSPTHYSNDPNNKLRGDWDNAWTEWVIKNVKDDKITFCCMGGLPWFFESIKHKIILSPWVNSFLYHVPVKGFKADFGIAPLVPNYFNYSKSCIKYQEYCADGIFGVGTVFTNGKPSPYDICLNKTPDNITVNELDNLFDQWTEPEYYNDTIKKQYKMIIDNGWYTESKQYIDLIKSVI
jgi:hypothetical protein